MLVQSWLDFIAKAPALIKIIVFFVGWVLLWLPIAILVAIASQGSSSHPLKAPEKLTLLLPLYAIAPLVLWGMSQLKAGTFSSWGFRLEPEFFRSLGWGLAIAVLGVAVLFILQLTWGWIKPQAVSQTSVAVTLLSTLLLGLWVSGIEELIFRGFLLNQLNTVWEINTAVIISSGIFALTHLIWEVKETLPQLPGLFMMGLVLSLARSLTGGNLGLAIGLHAGWIWAIASIDTCAPMLATKIVPEWVTGIGNKPLAGVLGNLLLLTTAGLLWQIPQIFPAFP